MRGAALGFCRPLHGARALRRVAARHGGRRRRAFGARLRHGLKALAAIGNEHPVRNRLAFAQHTEADRAVRKPLLSERQRLSGMHRAHELRRTDPPASAAATAFHDAHHLIEQYHAGENRRIGEMAGERRMLGGNGEGGHRVHDSTHAGVADFACAARAWSAASGSFPVSLRGSRATNSSGRGRKTASTRSRSA